MPDSEYASPEPEARLVDREGNFHPDADMATRVHYLIDGNRLAEAVRELALAQGIAYPDHLRVGGWKPNPKRGKANDG